MRDESNRKKLWELLDKGYINTIGSDHSPYEKKEKDMGLMDIWKAPNGIPGIQTLLPVLLNGVNKGLLSFERLVEVTSFNPARLYGLDYRKGSITVGYDADLAIVDMGLVKEFSKQDIKSKEKWSPYVGQVFKGWPILTMVRGEVVMRDGEIMVNKGYGIYIERKKR
jgi:dihydroorotase-like cyclic amidohydrolase